MNGAVREERLAERRRRPGTAVDRNVGPPPDQHDERGGERRQHNGTPADRGRFHLTRQEITLPTWVAYAIIGLGLCAVIWLGSSRITGVEEEQDAIVDSRVETTRSFCAELNANAARANAFGDFIETVIMEGAVLPGDKVVQYDVTGLPSVVKGGPVSVGLSREYRLPSAQQRLRQARSRVASLHGLRRPQIDCQREIEKIRAEQRAAE